MRLTSLILGAVALVAATALVGNHLPTSEPASAPVQQAQLAAAPAPVTSSLPSLAIEPPPPLMLVEEDFGTKTDAIKRKTIRAQVEMFMADSRFCEDTPDGKAGKDAWSFSTRRTASGGHTLEGHCAPVPPDQLPSS